MAAAELYKQALQKLGPDHDPRERARVTELLAKSYFKAAFQSQTHEEFVQRMRLAESTYTRLADLYEKSGSDGKAKSSMARSLFTKFWLKEDVRERRVGDHRRNSGEHRQTSAFPGRLSHALISVNWMWLVGQAG